VSEFTYKYHYGTEDGSVIQVHTSEKVAAGYLSRGLQAVSRDKDATKFNELMAKASAGEIEIEKYTKQQ
jgi:hypothetical protein